MRLFSVRFQSGQFLPTYCKIHHLYPCLNQFVLYCQSHQKVLNGRESRRFIYILKLRGLYIEHWILVDFKKIFPSKSRASVCSPDNMEVYIIGLYKYTLPGTSRSSDLSTKPLFLLRDTERQIKIHRQTDASITEAARHSMCGLKA